MAIKPRIKKDNDNNDTNIFWTTMSDLMLGLAIIFMTLFVFTITGFTQDALEQKKEQIEMAEKLVEELQANDIEAQVDKITGDIKISDLELFDVNSWTLSENGQKYLDKLIPIYINTIFSSNDIAEQINFIVVQGHTDSQSFARVSSKDEQFTKNMELSLKRANTVAEYIFKTDYDKKYSDKLKKIVVVEGKSFSEPILTNGVEDSAKSRRVELKLTLKDKNDKLMEALGL